MSVSSDPNAPDMIKVVHSDPHGEAALVLTESLIHGLLAQLTLSRDAALSIVQDAIDTQSEVDFARDGDDGYPSRASELLMRIGHSLSIDAEEPVDGAVPQV